MAPGGTWCCLVRRDIHAPHLRADAMPRTPELALASACHSEMKLRWHRGVLSRRFGGHQMSHFDVLA